jgi:hypothetical protein
MTGERLGGQHGCCVLFPHLFYCWAFNSHTRPSAPEPTQHEYEPGGPLSILGKNARANTGLVVHYLFRD